MVMTSCLLPEPLPCSSFVVRCWRSLLQLWLARYKKALGSNKDAKLKDHQIRLCQSHSCLSRKLA